MILSTKSRIFAILISIGLIVLLFFANKTAPEKEKVDVVSTIGIAEAVELIKSGKDPMKGILKLKDLVTENPKNIEAQFYLGVFSIQSGQYEKSVERLNTVLELDKDYNDAYLYLGYAYSALNKKEDAIANFEVFKRFTQDEELKKEIEKNIYELKNN